MLRITTYKFAGRLASGACRYCRISPRFWHFLYLSACRCLPWWRGNALGMDTGVLSRETLRLLNQRNRGLNAKVKSCSIQRIVYHTRICAVVWAAWDLKSWQSLAADCVRESAPSIPFHYPLHSTDWSLQSAGGLSLCQSIHVHFHSLYPFHFIPSFIPLGFHQISWFSKTRVEITLHQAKNSCIANVEMVPSIVSLACERSEPLPYVRRVYEVIHFIGKTKAERHHESFSKNCLEYSGVPAQWSHMPQMELLANFTL